MIARVRPLADQMLRLGATVAHTVLKAAWFIRRPKTYGAHAVPLTRGGRIVLVKLRYASGWRLPGGGRSPDEDPCSAALRELREEIGMTSHGDVKLACELDERVNFKRDTASLVVVRDVEYRPRKWSWEVEEVIEAPLDELPDDIAAVTAHWLRRVGPLL